MQKIIMLGTGNGLVFDLYNTCFVIQNDDKYLLVDTGGSAEIIRRLRRKNIPITKIHDIFISHCHTDHILGLFWLLKKISVLVKHKEYVGELNVYCNDEVRYAIESILPNVAPLGLVKEINKIIKLHVLNDNDTLKIAGREMTFFDCLARGNKLYGFDMILDNKERLVFVGDETLNKELYSKVENAEYVMHEAFCLDSEENIFHPYELMHSTVKSVCEIFNNLNVENLILFHTEETHLNDRKKLYIEEGKKVFSNNIMVPDDLEEISIC